VHLEIITPDKKIFQGEVSSAQFPGTHGSFEVLKGHAPLISTLENGQVKAITAKGLQVFQVDGGVVEVLRDNIIVLAEAVVE
jgi:F-type H+-transporting ATPase subunit epsilon